MEYLDTDDLGGLPVCPLCDRPIPPHAPQSLHHLIPKLKGGKRGPVVLLHHICHREIHASLSESALAREYNTISALRAHPRLAAFVAWVAKRPPEFSSKLPGARRAGRRAGRR
ncbi:MAG: HNH endonuclease [Roseinatronobacter sp.]|nr:HNH endonuclease [Roseinatronobacter sp.]